ncbi:MAG: prepilin peptidase [bacterium]|nr:prepilin peptidase [bacterium]
MSIQNLLDVYVFFFGLVFGSYLNVVIFRLPRGISTVLPRSRCPRCRAAIKPWDNIPVLSWLVLRGRCRYCGVGISWQYPMVELMTAVCFLLSYRRFDTLADGLVAGAFSAAMIVLGMIDLEHYILPDVITKPGIVAGLIAQIWVTWTTFESAVIGALLGAGVLAAVTWGWFLWKGVHGMGFGDVKMLAMIGAFLGWQGAIVTLLLGSVAGSLVGAVLMISGRLGRTSKLPFGVFLAPAAIVTLFWGRDLIDLYVDLSGLALLTAL